jgi:transcriptional regulator with XRE-family HTH domain
LARWRFELKGSPMTLTKDFGKALKKARIARKLTQEDFSDVSSRTYMSSLERGIKSPTIDKIDSLAHAMDLHPLTLLVLTYSLNNDKLSTLKLLDKINNELDMIRLS